MDVPIELTGRQLSITGVRRAALARGWGKTNAAR